MNSGRAWVPRCRSSAGSAGIRLGLCCAALGLAASACGAAGAVEGGKHAFGAAVEASLDEEWEEAASAAHAYLGGSSTDDERYDRAMLMLGRALEELGLTYAASLYYLDIAQSRRKVELLDKAVAGLERIVTGGPHDTETVVRGYLATADITDLSPEHQAFINYQQGLDSVRQDLDQWADALFDAIPRESPYFARAQYVRAVRMLARHKWEAAREALLKLRENEQTPDDVRNETELALARLAMERRQYGRATGHYERVRRLAPDRPELLLEMAWAHYYLGDSRRALGLLVALDAPIYGGLIAPERYLLEALCLRRLCQFEPARTAAVRLRVRHGDALRDLQRGIRPTESEPLRSAVRQRGEVRQRDRFVKQLRRELSLAEGLSPGEGLAGELGRRYRAGIAEAERRLEQAMAGEVQRLADELIAAEDGVQLILHELSVALLRGRSRPPGLEETALAEPGATEENVSYNFVGEFWTDELDDLVVAIEDRCLE
jgi:tetratricopeptide (TPR) repeat protein